MDNRNTTMIVGREPSQQSMGLIQAESQRAVQEVQAALVIAKQFPRNVKTCLDNILMSCTRPNLAQQAVYSYGRGGTEVTGPSIRLAECIAQNWTNIDFGFRELYRGVDYGTGYSEVLAFAWDMETNTRRQLQFRVKHWRDTKSGGYALKDERDIYEAVASQAQRRVRACILAVVPGDITDDAVKQCETTLAANADTSPETQKKIVEEFAKIGITKEQIEKRIQRRLDVIQPEQVIQLRKILMSIRDGMSNADEFFDKPEEAAAGSMEVDPIAEPR
jgi:hypothetical protein